MWPCGQVPNSSRRTPRCPRSAPPRPQQRQAPKLMTTPQPVPSVLFVCVKNGGKSQMAAALMRPHAQATGTRVAVYSAATQPRPSINQLAADVVAESGADMSKPPTNAIDPGQQHRVDRVVVLGQEAKVEPVEDMTGTIDTWITDEPSQRGIEGIDRMRIVRDDIDAHVRTLLTEFAPTES